MNLSQGASAPKKSLRLVKLKDEGRLQSGDTVDVDDHGTCTVAYIVNASSITVKDVSGSYINIRDLNFGGDVQLQSRLQ